MKSRTPFRGFSTPAGSGDSPPTGSDGRRGKPVPAARTGDRRRQGSLVTVFLLPVALLVSGCAVPAHPVPVTVPVSRPGTPAEPAAKPAAEPLSATPVLDLGAMPDLAGIIPRLAKKRVVYVGETHDQFAHHLVQLEIIRRLHKLHPQLAIGMEAFQQPFQSVLNDYIAGNLGEREMLRKSEYFSRWRMDYRLYAPILRYAREQHLPVVALNLPDEITKKVAHEGMDALSKSERVQLPATIDRSDKAYEQRLRKIFGMHPHHALRFDHFLDVQYLWDEGMAERAANWLAAHPTYHMVVLTGSGHLAWGSGIPRRLARRLPVSSAIVLNDWEANLQRGVADFLLFPAHRGLPPTGRFGVVLQADQQVPTVRSCQPDSPCARAGLKQGDRFLSIDGEPVQDMTDLHVAMWDKRPGDTVTLRVRRKHWFSTPQVLSYTIRLR